MTCWQQRELTGLQWKQQLAGLPAGTLAIGWLVIDWLGIGWLAAIGWLAIGWLAAIDWLATARWQLADLAWLAAN